MANNIFVSPGVYTSEKDITFVTKQVGVTTLGLVGETTKGPAFNPVFVSDYDEFKTFFGGLNTAKIADTGAPKYELPYIAKSYLSESNQLFVTRVLGLSGYDAGKTWGERRMLQLGKRGQYKTQVRSFNFGVGRDFVIRFGTSAPIPVTFYQMRLITEKCGGV